VFNNAHKKPEKVTTIVSLCDIRYVISATLLFCKYASTWAMASGRPSSSATKRSLSAVSHIHVTFVELQLCLGHFQFTVLRLLPAFEDSLSLPLGDLAAIPNLPVESSLTPNCGL
jgi:hypothetical protein